MQNVLALPATEAGIAKVRFRIERVDLAAPEASGRQGGVQIGFPLWQARYQLERMDGVSGDLWRSFLDRLRGRQRLFLGGDVTRPFPRLYRGGFGGMTRATGGAFSGSATGWSQTINSDGEAVLALSGLPAGLALEPGDYVGFKWDAAGLASGNHQRRAMVRISEAAQASGGGVINVIVEPPLDTNVVPVGAIAHLDKPQCLLRQVPGDSDLGGVGTGFAVEGGTLVAMQELRP